jgi:hypothetical protein
MPVLKYKVRLAVAEAQILIAIRKKLIKRRKVDAKSLLLVSWSMGRQRVDRFLIFTPWQPFPGRSPAKCRGLCLREVQRSLCTKAYFYA